MKINVRVPAATSNLDSTERAPAEGSHSNAGARTYPLPPSSFLSPRSNTDPPSVGG